jgi:hypothetical protein
MKLERGIGKIIETGKVTELVCCVTPVKKIFNNDKPINIRTIMAGYGGPN